MKRVLIFSSLMIATILSGCLSEKEREEVKALERAAKEKMEAFLEDEFEDYKILEYEQYVDLGFLESNYISDITEFSVKIDGEKYVFAYCADSDTYWSNYYFDEIFDDLKDKLSNYEILNEAYNYEINIYGNEIRVLEEKLFLHEDKNVDDVIDRMKNSDAYNMKCSYYFNNKSNFNPTDLGLDCIYNDFSNLKLDLYNTEKDIYDPAYVLDRVTYEDSDRNGYRINVEYSHKKLVFESGRYFSYDDNFYDVNITYIEYDENDPERTNYPETKFKRWGEAYKIKIEKVADIDIKMVETSFVNESGIEVKVVYEDYQYLNMYFAKDMYENKYLYNSYSKRMENIYSYGEGIYADNKFLLRDMDNYSFIIALYEKVN